MQRDYFVYSMAAEGKSFYVGIGRSSRATDRVRYVKYLVRRLRDGEKVKWVLSNEVIAMLLRRGVTVKPKLLRTNLTRPRALQEERKIIAWFQSRGVVLANRQHNGGGTLRPLDVVRDVRRRIKC
jgi:hypothetical protein